MNAANPPPAGIGAVLQRMLPQFGAAPAAAPPAAQQQPPPPPQQQQQQPQPQQQQPNPDEHRHAHMAAHQQALRQALEQAQLAIQHAERANQHVLQAPLHPPFENPHLHAPPFVPASHAAAMQSGAPPVTTLPPVQQPIILTPLSHMPPGAVISSYAQQPLVLDHLSDEQLRRMEGLARPAIEQRLRALHEIQSQLTGITTQLTQLLQLMPEQPADETRGRP
ncbi:E3 ubiquitin-protein ligase hrd1 [Polyrhizophydium stewartii]|uniref:E3 ubiquitin-protein ligase hrd1 n=1 Tax=Polyrhizophydium stewartii TaxID=2732419 RepID=A0ABR4N726_9FUNG